MSQELSFKKQNSDETSPNSLKMPIFKSNKRIFLNQLEKYTADLLKHMEDLDFSQPKELSQITDVLSDDLKSDAQNNSNLLEKTAKEKEEVSFPKLQKAGLSTNRYYEAKGYKNYKYKFFNIDIDELGKCQKLGKKFDINKYIDGGNQTKSSDQKAKDLKKNKSNNLSILTKKLKKFSEGEGSFPPNESLDTEGDIKGVNKSVFPKIMPSKSLFNEANQRSRESINEKIITQLINRTDKNEATLVKCERSRKDPSIFENFSVMEKITEPLANPDRIMKIQLNFWNISKILNKFGNKKEERYNFEAKKEKTILNEFISLTRNSILAGAFIDQPSKKDEQAFLFLEVFKENFEIFRTNDTEINNRILLAFGLNPYNNMSKINWETFLKFKKVIVIREASLKENVEFLANVSIFFFFLEIIIKFLPLVLQPRKKSLGGIG